MGTVCRMDLQPLSDEQIRSLRTEPHFLEDTAQDQSRRIFEQNLVNATRSICNLAVNSANERIRLQAATYVVERNLGRVQDNPPAPKDDPISSLLGDVVTNLDPEVIEELRNRVRGNE